MPLTKDDRRYLRRAFLLAEKGYSGTRPNPRVGCVLVRDGRIVAEAHHEAAGEAHAERIACARAGDKIEDAVAYVSLEPCCHHGKTPPCTDALLEGYVERVVFGVRDVDPRVNGRGEKTLRDGRIEAVCADWRTEHLLLNPGYECAIRLKRPWLRLKLAISIDGYAALADGSSQWISNEKSRADNQRWRARSDAVLSTWRTAMADKARLNVRNKGLDGFQPLRVILDRGLNSDPDALVYATDPGSALIFRQPPPAPAPGPGGRWQALIDQGLSMVAVDAGGDSEFLDQCLDELFRRGRREIHIEAGPRLSSFLLDNGYIDELLLYQAPILLGQGRPICAGAPSSLSERADWQLCSVKRLGDDLRLQYLHPRWGSIEEMARV